jgi:hypothetical protein
MIQRRAAAVASIVLVAAVLAPLARDPHDDSFPLSTYPMFASPRPTTQTLDYALGMTTAGERRVLEPRLVGTGEVLEALAIVGRAIRSGRSESLALCTQIAERVARDPGYADVVMVRLVTGTHDAVELLRDGRLGREGEHVRCAVAR